LRPPASGPDQDFLQALEAEGRGDDSAAAELYHRAAQAGHAPAMNNLGLMHFEGRGVRKSYSEAACWYGESAQLGFAKAQANLAVMKYFGLGTPCDAKEAGFLLMLAHSQGLEQAGYSMAMFNLGADSTPLLAAQGAEQPMRITILKD
jgi:TPR repeat protein